MQCHRVMSHDANDNDDYVDFPFIFSLALLVPTFPIRPLLYSNITTDDIYVRIDHLSFTWIFCVFVMFGFECECVCVCVGLHCSSHMMPKKWFTIPMKTLITKCDASACVIDDLKPSPNQTKMNLLRFVCLFMDLFFSGRLFVALRNQNRKTRWGDVRQRVTNINIRARNVFSIFRWATSQNAMRNVYAGITDRSTTVKLRTAWMLQSFQRICYHSFSLSLSVCQWNGTRQPAWHSDPLTRIRSGQLTPFRLCRLLLYTRLDARNTSRLTG